MDDTKLALLLLALAALALVAVALVMLVRFWRLRRQLESLPGGARFAFWGAVIYTVFPIDALPDPIVLDDIGVLAGASLYLHKLIRERDLLRRRNRPVVTRPTRPGDPELPARPVPEPGPREAGRRRI